MALSENIKLLREHFNITQQELAEIAGVTDGAVSTWELGKNQPRISVIRKIADHFDIDINNLLDDDGMITILNRPYNLNDMERFERLPQERLNRKQKAALNAGQDFASNIGDSFKGLSEIMADYEMLDEESKAYVSKMVKLVVADYLARKDKEQEGGDDK